MISFPSRVVAGVRIASGVVLASFPAAADDWPQWRGAARDAKVSGFQAPATWPKELVKKWSVPVGGGVATPALVGGKLYVFAREGDDEVIRCLDAGSGEKVWEDRYTTLGADGPARSFAGPRCSPAVAEGKVVTLGVRGVLSCLDAADGTLVWRKDEFKGSWPGFFTSSSPVIAGGLCVAQLGGREDGAIVAYDLASGEEKWRWTGDGTAYASPVMLEVAGEKLVVTETEGKVVAVMLADGQLVWETPFKVQGRGYNSATPLYEGDTVYYAGSNRGITAVRLGKEGEQFAGKELWTNQDQSVGFSTPVLRDGHLFGLSGDDQIFCVETAGGKTKWSQPLGGSAQTQATPPEARTEPAAADQERPGPGERGEGFRGRRGPGGPGGPGRSGGRRQQGYGSLVDAGPVILLLTPASELVVFQPSAEAYSEAARIKVADTPTHAYPVLSGDKIYVKDADSVILWSLQ